MQSLTDTAFVDTSMDTVENRSWIQKGVGVLAFLWRWGVGVLLTQTFLTAIFVVGWTYRLMQRYALYRMIKRSAKQHPFREFRRRAGENPALRNMLSPPNWFVQQNARSRWRENQEESDSLWQTVKTVGWLPFHSAGQNLKIGVQALFNTYILTLVPCLLWQFAWHAGWNNSFNKMYEQAHVGIVMGITGILIFVIVMLYLPMAQARQAVSGEWRAFYAFRANGRLIRSSWFSCAMLAGLFCLVSLPLTIFKTVPAFLPQGNPSWEKATSAELLQFLNTYFFWVSFICLAGYLLVKLASVRVYVAALQKALCTHRIQADELTPLERSMLQAAAIEPREDEDDSLPLIRAGKWMGGKMKAVVSIVLILLFWVIFVFQIYISEFLNYHTYTRAWMNQPLIHFPVFRYVPPSLQQAAEQERATPEAPEREEGQT